MQRWVRGLATAGLAMGVLMAPVSPGVGPDAQPDGVGVVLAAPAFDDLAVEFTAFPDPARRGKDAIVTIATTAGAACGICVRDKTACLKGTAFKTVAADDDGVATWKWKVAADARLGADWKVEVTCRLDDEKTVLKQNMTVAR